MMNNVRGQHPTLGDWARPGLIWLRPVSANDSRGARRMERERSLLTKLANSPMPNKGGPGWKLLSIAVIAVTIASYGGYRTITTNYLAPKTSVSSKITYDPPASEPDSPTQASHPPNP